MCVGFTKSQSDEDEKAKVEWTISAPTNRVYVDHELAGDTYQIRKTDNAVGSDAGPYEIELDGGGTANLYLFKLDALDTSDSCFACLEEEAFARECLSETRCAGKAFDTGGMAISEKAPDQVADLADVSNADLDGRRIELTFHMPLSKGLPITSLVVRRQAVGDSAIVDYRIGCATSDNECEPGLVTPIGDCNEMAADQNLGRTECVLPTSGGEEQIGYVVEKYVEDSATGIKKARGESFSVLLGSWENGNEKYITPTQAYTWSVLAINDKVDYTSETCTVGTQSCPWSATITRTQKQATPDKPGDPAASVSDTALTLQWGVPNDNGNAITGYRVACEDVSTYTRPSAWQQAPLSFYLGARPSAPNAPTLDLMDTTLETSGTQSIDIGVSDSATTSGIQLAPGTKYRCQVVPYNDFEVDNVLQGGLNAPAFYSAWSSVVTTLAKAPEAVSEVEECTAVPQGTTSVGDMTVPSDNSPAGQLKYTIKWTPPRPNDDSINNPGSGNYWKWRYFFTGTGIAEPASAVGATRKTSSGESIKQYYDFTGLTYNQQYSFCVESAGKGCASGDASPCFRSGTPGACAAGSAACNTQTFHPGSPTMDDFDDRAGFDGKATSLKIRFKAPTELYGSTVTGYSFIMCPKGPTCDPTSASEAANRRYICDQTSAPSACGFVPPFNGGWFEFTIDTYGAGSGNSVQSGTEYSISVRAEDSDSNRIGFASSPSITGKTAPVPTLLSDGVSSNARDIKVQWDKYTYDGGDSYADEFDVYLCSGATCSSSGSSIDNATLRNGNDGGDCASDDGTEDPGTTDCSYTFTGLTPATEYTVVIVGRVTTGQTSGDSSAVAITTTADRPEKLGAPTIEESRTRSADVKYTVPAASDWTRTANHPQGTWFNGAGIESYIVKHCKTNCASSFDSCTCSETEEENTFAAAALPQTEEVPATGEFDPFTNYLVWVVAQNSVGFSDPSDKRFVSRSATDNGGEDCREQPDQLLAPLLDDSKGQNGLTNSSIWLKWTRPASNGEPVTQYRVLWTVETRAGGVGVPGSETLSAPDEAEASHEVDGLQPGNKYTFKVAAYNSVPRGVNAACGSTGSDGWSIPSPISSQFSTLPVKPKAPGAPTLSARGGTSLTIEWLAPFDNGDAITEFFVYSEASEISLDNGQLGAKVQVDGQATQGRSFAWNPQNLRPVTEYTFRVSAKNGAGESDLSLEAVFTTDVYEPEYPLNIVAAARTASSISLDWSPAVNNGINITLYEICYNELQSSSSPESVCGKSDSGWKVASGTQTIDSYPTPGTPLTESTAYEVSVRACNAYAQSERCPEGDPSEECKSGADGCSNWSPFVKLTTTSSGLLTPPAPVVSLVNATSATAFFKWRVRPKDDFDTLGTTAIAVFKPTLTDSETGGVEVLDLITGDAFSEGEEYLLSVTGLSSATSYSLTVSAGNVDGFGEESIAVVFTTGSSPPEAPDAPSFDRTLPNVLLHLSGAAADNGEPITQYQWQVKLSDQWGNPTDCGSNPNDSTCRVIADTSYSYTYPSQSFDFRVRAYNALGPGEWSEATTVTPTDLQPAAPSLDAVTAAGIDSIEILWSAGSGAAAADTYRLEISEGDCAGDEGCRSRLVEVDASVLSYNLPALPGTLHTVQVFAGNLAGYSEVSSSLSATTLAAPPPPSQPPSPPSPSPPPPSPPLPSPPPPSPPLPSPPPPTPPPPPPTPPPPSPPPPATSSEPPQNVDRGSGVDLGSALASSQIHVVWGAPADDGGKPVTEYCLTVTDLSSSPSAVVLPSTCLGEYPGGGLPRREHYFTTDGIFPGQEFEFAVVARNEIGDSAPATATLSTASSVPDRLDTPALLRTEPPNVPLPDNITIGIRPLSMQRLGGGEIVRYEIYESGALVQTFEAGDVAGRLEACGCDYLEHSPALYDVYSEYIYRTRAVSTVGNGTLSYELVIDAAASNAPVPVNVRVTSTESRAVTIAWKIIKGSSDSEWDRVRLTLTCNEEDCDSVVEEDVQEVRESACQDDDVGYYSCSYVVSGARPITQYAVTAQSGKGGAYSESSLITDDSRVTTLPGAPQPPALDAAQPTQTSVKLRWTVPRDNGPDVTGFVARYASAGGASAGGGEGAVLLAYDGAAHASSGAVNASLSDDELCGLVPTAPASSVGSTLESELVGLQPGTTYDLSLVACNSLGASTKAKASAHTHDVPDRPDPPSLGSGVTSTSLDIEWQLPYDHGLAVSGSELEFSGSATNYSGVTTSRVGLLPATPYEVRVRAFNDAGPSSFSEPAFLWTAPDAPSRPVLEGGSCGEPVEGSGLSLLKGDLVANGQVITKVEVKTQETASGQSTARVDTFVGAAIDTPSLMLTRNGEGFVDYRDYSVQMRAENKLGWSDWSVPITCTPAPETDAQPPQNPEAEPLGPAAVEVRWEMPANSSWDGFVVSLDPVLESSAGRRLQLEDCAVEAPQRVDIEIDSLFCPLAQGGRRLCELNVTGGTPNTTYTVSVQSRLGQGTSSTPPELPVVRMPPGPPQEPQCLSLSSVTDTTLRFGWLTPRDHGIAIAGFLVTYTAARSEEGTTTGVGPGGESLPRSVDCSAVASAVAAAGSNAGPEGGALVAEVSGLQTGTSYAISISTCNVDGELSLASAELGVGEAHTHAVPDRPAAPRIDTGADVTPRGFTVLWEAPSSACRGQAGCVDDHGLAVDALELEFDGQVVDASLGGGAHVATDLKPATAYPVRLRFNNSLGASDWSDIAYLWSDPTVPDQPDPPACSESLRSARMLAVVPGEVVSNGKDVVAWEFETRPMAATSGEGDYASNTSVDPARLADSCGSLLFDGAPSELATPPSACDGAALLSDGVDTPEAEYRVRARAVNALGASGWSDATVCSTAAEAVEPFPVVFLVAGLGGAVLCLVCAMIAVWKTNLHKVVAPKLRRKKPNDEPLKTFVTQEAVPNEDEDPELVMNPVLMAHLALEEDRTARKGKEAKKGSKGKAGRSGGLRRLGLNIDGSKQGPSRPKTGKELVDAHLAEQRARDTAVNGVVQPIAGGEAAGGGAASQEEGRGQAKAKVRFGLVR